MSEQKPTTLASSFGFPKSTPKRLQEDIEIKADYTVIDEDGGGSDESLNFGIGYSF